jgi:riboflavin-specific deaminase-like protein
MRREGSVRLRVSINMAISMDGKIATSARGPVKLGSAYDSRRMSELRALHDAVINGASTFKAHPFPLHVVGKALLAARRRRGQSPQPISAIVSSRLEIPRGTPWERARGADRWAFCGRNAPPARVRSLEKSGVRVVRTKGARPSAGEILRELARAGVKSVLVEGGGEFNASFVEQGLVDRVHLTLTPLVIGGAEAPTWLEGKGLAKGKFPRFRLAEVVRKGDELYLTYDRVVRG